MEFVSKTGQVVVCERERKRDMYPSLWTDVRISLLPDWLEVKLLDNVCRSLSLQTLL